MKKLFTCVILVISCTLAKAQLANTKWAGTMMVPASTNIVLHFKKDTLELSLQETNDVIETMSYSVTGDMITFKKISGGSPCEDGIEAKLKYLITGDKLAITVISDPCEERSSSWTKEPYIKKN